MLDGLDPKSPFDRFHLIRQQVFRRSRDPFDGQLDSQVAGVCSQQGYAGRIAMDPAVSALLNFLKVKPGVSTVQVIVAENELFSGEVFTPKRRLSVVQGHN